MSDDTDVPYRIFAATGPIAAAAALIFVAFFLSRCEGSVQLEREKTKQEAIKAGLVQGEFDRWGPPLLPKAEKMP